MSRYGKMIAVVLVLTACAFAQEPKLTDAQERDIRAAQVESMLAQQQLQASMFYQAQQEAQKKLNQVIEEIYKQAGVDKAKFQLQEVEKDGKKRIAFVAVPKPEAKAETKTEAPKK